MKTQFKLALALAVLFPLGFAQKGLAQLNRSVVVGRVQDSTGAVVPGAEVQMKRLSTNELFKTVTTDTGDFSIVGLPSDVYEIGVSKTDFKSEVRTGIKLDVGRTYRIDFQLSVGEVTQRVTVVSEAPMLKTETPEFGQVIGNQTLVDLPVNTRNFTSLLSLSAGVKPLRGSYGAEGFNVDFNVRGQRVTDNIVYLDGTMLQDTNGAMYSLPNMDALQEFNLRTGLYGAEFGVKPGGHITAITKSGTNALHGTLFEFLRNNHLDARSFFDPGPRPQFKRNQFGGVVGGPIYIPGVFNGKDKAWFFFSYAGQRQRDIVSLTGIVPTPDQKAGVFTTPITDPLTGQPFANNTIPANRISPQSQKFLGFWPNPNTSGALNFTSPNTSLPADWDDYIAKVDYNFSPTNRWSVRFLKDRKPLYNSNLIQDFSFYEPLDTYSAEISNVRTFGAQIVNDFGFHFFRQVDTIAAPTDNPGFAQSLGIPNYPSAPLDYFGVMPVSLTGYAGVGAPGFEVEVPLGNWEVKDDLSFNRGSHSFKAGYEWRRQYDFYNIPTSSSVAFTNRFTGDPFGDFLLGFPTSSSVGAELYRGNFAQNSQYFYFQDNWKVTSKLTATLGLRYEYRGPWKDKRGFQSNFDLAGAGQLVPPLQNLTLQPWQTGRFESDYPLITFGKLGFLPRIGLAYRLTSKTVIRAGFGEYSNELIIGMNQELSRNPRPNAGGFTYLTGLTTPTLSFSDPFNLANQSPGATLFNARGIQSPLPLPRVHSWGVAIQQQLTGNMSFEIGYEGSQTQHDLTVTSFNDAIPGPGDRQDRRPYPGWQALSITLANGTSSYNGLEMKLEKNLGPEGITGLLSYTWAKSIDDVGGRLSIAGDPTGISRNVSLSANRGLSEANIPSRLAYAIGYEFPFGPGKKFLSNSWAGKVFGGWSVQSIGAFESGPFLTAIIPSDILDVGSTASLRPDLLSNPNLPSSQRTVQRWFDTGAFALPSQPYTYGNAGRSIIKGPGYVIVDGGVHRSFRTSETTRLEFRFEAFNAPNHANFGYPGLSFGTGSFGVIGGAKPGRSLQFGLKFYF